LNRSPPVSAEPSSSVPPMLSGLAALTAPPLPPPGKLGTSSTGAASLCFKASPVAGVECQWETILLDGRLYVEVPPGILPQGSRDSLVDLLEFAEENLKCSHVILCFKRNRPDRASLLRVFNFFGFSLVGPAHPLAPPTEDLLFMAYLIQGDDSSDDDDEDDTSESGSE